MTLVESWLTKEVRRTKKQVLTTTILTTTSLGFKAKGIVMSFIMFMFELNTLESGHMVAEKFKPLNQKEGFAFVK